MEPVNSSLTDEQYREFAYRALESYGYLRGTKGDADVVVRMVYGIGQEKRSQVSGSLPVFGQTGVSSSHTYGTVTPNYGGASFTADTYNVPTYGITGYRPYSYVESTYDRQLVMEGKKQKSSRPHWRLEVASTGSSGDLTYVMPYMLVAAADRFGIAPGIPTLREIKPSAVNRMVHRLTSKKE
jgi:hypothetical protein